MHVTCSTCASVFEVGDGEIGPNGSNVRCPICGSLNMVAGRSGDVHFQHADIPFVPGRTITLEGTDELLELEDDALIELDDDEEITQTIAYGAPQTPSAEGAAHPTELEHESSDAESNPIAPNPFALPVEPTPTPEVPEGAWGASPFEDTYVGADKSAASRQVIEVSALELQEEAPASDLQVEVDTDVPPVVAASEVPSSPPPGPEAAPDPFNQQFEVLNAPEGVREESTLVVRKRRAPRPEEASADMLALSPDEMPHVPDEAGTAEHTMPRVRQDELRPGQADPLTDPRLGKPVKFQRKRSRAGVVVRWTLTLCVIACAAGGGYWYLRVRPIAPPEVANPLEQRADDWRKSGQKPQFAKVDDAAAAVIEGLASGTNAGRIRALNAAKAAVLADPKSPGAVSLYARALAARDEPIDNATLNDVLQAITSVIGDAPSDAERPILETSRAWLLLRSGRMDEAREAAARAVTTRSDYAPAQVVALAADATLKPEYAAQQLSQLLTAPEVSGEARLWMGEAQLHDGKVADAIATWRAGLREVPADAPFIGRLARVQADLGDYATAVDLLQQNITRGAATLGDVLLLARLQARALHKLRTALETLDAAQSERADQPFALAMLIAERAMVAYAVQPPVAADDLNTLVDAMQQKQPDVPTLIYAGGIMDYANGSSKKEAGESFEAAQTIAPDVPEVAFALASIIRTTDVPTAYEVIATALKDHPDYVPLHLLEALIAAEHDDKARVAAAVKKALLYDPQLYAQRTLFSVYAEPTQPMIDVAKALGEQALRLDNTLLRTATGVLYVLIGDNRNGPLWLTKALRDDPNDFGAHLYSAIFNYRRGIKKAARADVLAAERGDRRQSLMRLYKGRILEQFGKLAEAAKIYRDLLDQNPLNAGAHVGLARVERLQGDEPGAREEARKALTIRPRDREAMRMLVADAATKPQPGRKSR